MKDLKEILCFNSETMGETKADLVLKVYAILMQNVLRPVENQQQNADNSTQIRQDTMENRSDFKESLLSDGPLIFVSFLN